MKKQSSIKHILVIRLSAMGDVAMSVPVLRAFTKQHPDIKLTVLTRKFYAPLLDSLTNVSSFYPDLEGKHKGIIGLYRLSRELRALEIDAIADLHNVLRSNVLKFFLSGIKTIQIDKGRLEKKALILGKQFKQLKSTHERYTDVFNSLGFRVNLSSPEFPTKAKLKDSILKITGKKDQKWIGIAPFAAHKGKIYPLDLMEKVIANLPREYKIFFFGGGESETSQLQVLQSKYDNSLNLAGKLYFREELQVISNLDIMLSMDSGNGHLAAIYGVPVLTIWGVTHPYAGFTPFNQPIDNQLLADRSKYPLIPTSVYGNNCPDGYEEAAGSIAVEAVVNKIAAIIEK